MHTRCERESQASATHRIHRMHRISFQLLVSMERAIAIHDRTITECVPGGRQMHRNHFRALESNKGTTHSVSSRIVRKQLPSVRAACGTHLGRCC